MDIRSLLEYLHNEKPRHYISGAYQPCSKYSMSSLFVLVLAVTIIIGIITITYELYKKNNSMRHGSYKQRPIVYLLAK